MFLFLLFLRKFECLRPETLLKKRHWQKCFPVNFAKFLRTSFLYGKTPAAASVYYVTPKGSAQASIHLCKIDNENTSTMCEICSKLTINIE